MILDDTLAAELEALERIFDDALEHVMPNPVALRFSDIRLEFQFRPNAISCSASRC